MRFWDASAVVPLVIDEPKSLVVKRLADDDPAIAAWWATRTECMSAVARLRRDRKITSAEET